MSTPNKTFYLVTMRDTEKLLGETLTLKVSEIGDSNLGLSFICLRGFLFDSPSDLIIDPNSDKIRQRYENTKGLHVSIYHILSVEEVGMENRGLKFKQDKNNLLVLNPESN